DAASTIGPAVQGQVSVSKNQLSFQPLQPLAQGQEYIVTVRAGVQANTGHMLKHDLQWHFRVTPPRILYLGPADNIVQNLYLVDPSLDQPPQKLTRSTDG